MRHKEPKDRTDVIDRCSAYDFTTDYQYRNAIRLMFFKIHSRLCSFSQWWTVIRFWVRVSHWWVRSVNGRIGQWSVNGELDLTVNGWLGLSMVGWVRQWWVGSFNGGFTGLGQSMVGWISQWSVGSVNGRLGQSMVGWVSRCHDGGMG